MPEIDQAMREGITVPPDKPGKPVLRFGVGDIVKVRLEWEGTKWGSVKGWSWDRKNYLITAGERQQRNSVQELVMVPAALVEKWNPERKDGNGPISS